MQRVEKYENRKTEKAFQIYHENITTKIANSIPQINKKKNHEKNT